MKKNKTIMFCAAFVLVLFAQDLFAQQKLLIPVSNEDADSRIDKAMERVVENQKAKSKSGRVELFEFNKGALQGSSIEIQIAGVNITLAKDEVVVNGPEEITWYGHSDDGSTAALVYLNGDLSGTIISRGKKYALSPLGKGKCSVYEVDESSFPKDHPENEKDHAPATNDASPSFDLEDATGVCNVRVLVAYTPAAQTGAASIGYSDMKLFALQSIANANQTYINSLVGHRLFLAATIRVTYTESGSFATDVNRFQATADGYMDVVHTYRNIYTADMCALMINNSSACGRAYGIGVSATGAFCTVHYDCALGNYSFAHELGHLYGCRHNPESDNTSTPFAYGHGYNNVPAGWRTVMAYNDGATSTTRLPYWSNPNVFYGGLPMGIAATRNNARVLNERDVTMAGFRSPSATLTINSNGALRSGETGDAVATTKVVLSPGFVARSGSSFKATVGNCTSTFRLADAGLSDLNSSSNDVVSAVSIYPNPNNGNFKVGFNYGVNKQVKISVVNSLGNEIYSKDLGLIDSAEERLELDALPPGLYLVNIDADGDIETKQIMLVR